LSVGGLRKMSNLGEIESLIRARFTNGMLKADDLNELKGFITALLIGERRKKIVFLQEERERKIEEDYKNMTRL